MSQFNCDCSFSREELEPKVCLMWVIKAQPQRTKPQTESQLSLLSVTQVKFLTRVPSLSLSQAAMDWKKKKTQTSWFWPAPVPSVCFGFSNLNQFQNTSGFSTRLLLSLWSILSTRGRAVSDPRVWSKKQMHLVFHKEYFHSQSGDCSAALEFRL